MTDKNKTSPNDDDNNAGCMITRKVLRQYLYGATSTSKIDDHVSFANALKLAIDCRNTNIRLIMEFLNEYFQKWEFSGSLNIGLNNYCEKLIDKPLTLAIVGGVNSGKSSLINEMLMKKSDFKLPEKEGLITRRITRLVYSDRTVYREIDLKNCQDKQYLRENYYLNKNDLHQRIIVDDDMPYDEVFLPTIAEIGLPNDLLQCGVQIIDFPPIDESIVLTDNVIESIIKLKPSLIIYVYDYCNGFSLKDAETVINLYKSLIERKLTQFIIVANKVDRVDPRLNELLNSDDEETLEFDAPLTVDDVDIERAERELCLNCSSIIRENTGVVDDFRVESLLPIIPLSSIMSLLKEYFEDDATMITKYERIKSTFQQTLINKIILQARNCLFIVKETIENSHTIPVEMKASLWFQIQSILLEESLFNLLSNKCSQFIRCIDFTHGYRMIYLSWENRDYQITQIRNEQQHHRLFIDDYLLDNLYYNCWSQTVNNLRAYVSEDETSISLINVDAPHRRVIDCIQELSPEIILSIIKQIALKSGIRNPQIYNFRPDNIYIEVNNSVYINQTIPFDFPLILKDEFLCPPHHILPQDDSIEEEEIVQIFTDIESAEFLYCFGWLVWILVEGSGKTRIPTSIDNDKEEEHQQWLSILNEHDRMKEFPDYLTRVMTLCWNVKRGKWEFNQENWFQVCLLIGIEEQLIFAAIDKNFEHMKTCIQHGIDVNGKHRKLGSTALHIASQMGSIECIKQLLDLYNADVNSQNNVGATPLLIAAQYGQTEVVKLLLENNADPTICVKDSGETPLHCAVQKNRQQCLKILLDHRGNNRPNINQQKSNGCSALFAAAQMNYVECVQMLLEAGADPNIVNKHAAGPLYVAAQQGNLESLQLLLKYKAQQDLYTKNGLTPLYAACQQDQRKSVKLLLKYDALPDSTKEKTGFTPIFVAAKNGNLKCLKYLIKYGANINAKLTNGNTPAHIASREGHSKCLKRLIQYGADINVKNNNGNTPLFVAAKFGRAKCVRIILQKNGDPNISNKEGMKPIEAAYIQKNMEIVKLLLPYDDKFVPSQGVAQIQTVSDDPDTEDSDSSYES